MQRDEELQPSEANSSATFQSNVLTLVAPLPIPRRLSVSDEWPRRSCTARSLLQDPFDFSPAVRGLLPVYAVVQYRVMRIHIAASIYCDNPIGDNVSRQKTRRVTSHRIASHRIGRRINRFGLL